MIVQDTLITATGEVSVSGLTEGWTATEHTAYMGMWMFDGESLTVEAVDDEAREAFWYEYTDAIRGRNND